MPDTVSIQPALATHGADRLPKVHVDSYNVELADEEGFIGDRVSRRAFRSIIEKWRKPLRELRQDPFGDEASERISKKSLDELLAGGHPEAAGTVHGAIENFAQELAEVTRRFLKLKLWRDTERIVIGGGLRGGRVGELAVGRAAVILTRYRWRAGFRLGGLARAECDVGRHCHIGEACERTIGEAARVGGMDRQTLRDWVILFARQPTFGGIARRRWPFFSVMSVSPALTLAPSQ